MQPQRPYNSGGVVVNYIAIAAIGVALTGALPAVPAVAQAAPRTFVSPTGNDSNKDCSITAPCRTFKAAFAATKAGGEISVLGTADYGILTVNKAISIVNGGGFEAGIMVPHNGFGIWITAGPNDAVSLRGLTIEGGAGGILFQSGQSLTVDNCMIHRADIALSFGSTATSSLLVSNSLLVDNNFGAQVAGLGSGTVSAVFNRVQANNNKDSVAGTGVGITVSGVDSTGTVKVTVYDSIASANGDSGFFVSTRPGYAPTTLMLFNSVAANNERGLVANGGATIRVAHSTVTGNNLGWVTSNGGVMQSYGDNYIDGNQTSESAPPGIAHK
jgi:parallel beta helix pectate lyase-like protein